MRSVMPIISALLHTKGILAHIRHAVTQEVRQITHSDVADDRLRMLRVSAIFGTGSQRSFCNSLGRSQQRHMENGNSFCNRCSGRQTGHQRSLNGNDTGSARLRQALPRSLTEPLMPIRDTRDFDISLPGQGGPFDLEWLYRSRRNDTVRQPWEPLEPTAAGTSVLENFMTTNRVQP